MVIQTLRFGEIDVPEEQIIEFPIGIPGFSEGKKFIPIQYREGSPLLFLQSVDLPELTFIIGDPFMLIANYTVEIPPDDLEALQIKSPEEVAIYMILTLREGGKHITANLLAPLVINTRTQKGRQVILHNTPYNSKYVLTSQG